MLRLIPMSLDLSLGSAFALEIPTFASVITLRLSGFGEMVVAMHSVLLSAR
jgi:hypothetical protein